MVIKYQLQQQLENNNMTPYKLSKASGVSKSYIYNLLNGKMTNPSISILQLLANALGVELETLLK